MLSLILSTADYLVYCKTVYPKHLLNLLRDFLVNL